MYRILLVETPDYYNKKYLNTKELYQENIKEFHKRYIVLKTKLTDGKFKIKLIGFDNSVMAEYSKLNPNKIFNKIDSGPMANVKGSNLSLYSNYNPETSEKNVGFKDKEKALYTIDKIKKRPLRYQVYLISTMLGRAKNHPHQTKEMRDAIKIFQKWLDEYHKNKN